jgi:hypothetical protein
VPEVAAGTPVRVSKPLGVWISATVALLVRFTNDRLMVTRFSSEFSRTAAVAVPGLDTDGFCCCALVR